MKTVDRLFNKHMTLKTGNIDYMSRNAFHRALKEYTSQNDETKAIQKQNGDPYHMSCQNCGTTEKPLQMIPLRNDNNVVGMLFSCDDCKKELYGQRFDRECKFTVLPKPKEIPEVTEEEIEKLKLEWQKHNRDNGLSWNEVAELVNQIIKLKQ